jgi:hypothetical protein
VDKSAIELKYLSVTRYIHGVSERIYLIEQSLIPMASSRGWTVMDARNPGPITEPGLLFERIGRLP